MSLEMSKLSKVSPESALSLVSSQFQKKKVCEVVHYYRAEHVSGRRPAPRSDGVILCSSEEWQQ